MFTGLIEEVGTVTEVDSLDDGRRFRVAAAVVLEGVSIGDSISLDGACHTVTSFGAEFFEVFSASMTLSRTTMATFRPGRRVNLERAMALGDRLGGHMVQGHIDGVGKVTRIDEREGHVLIDFALPEIVAAVTILHGSIALNGISLTINAMPSPDVAQVSIIPHTWEATSIRDLRVGDQVNLEGDMIGKYVRQLLGGPDQAGSDASGTHVRERWGYER